ncbi:alpha/beta hydrolase [Alcanivorax sp.]|jgi:pimeloyl-ACP methyl ester carboxylesterase|uniref:alpha/beta fold hydrolase n=1 Tax=Alcanivorax sp. TaxID=1872427 RepID=UPI0032D9640D
MLLFPARDGVMLRVRLLGRGEPVLMLHGLGMQGRDWLPFVFPFLRRFQFVIPDLRGAGGSAAARFNQADVFHNHMQDMEDLVSYLGLRDFLLVGYSLGATTSLHWHAHGDFSPVKRYLHIDQSPCTDNKADWPHGLFGKRQEHFYEQLRELLVLLDGAPDQGNIAKLAPGLRTAVLFRLTDILGQIAGRRGLHSAFNGSAWLSPLWARVLPVVELADIRAYLHAYLFGAHDYRSSAANFGVPATVITGARSALYPPQGQAELARLIGARQVVLPRSGHVPLMSQPLAFTRALGDFLREG